MIQKRVQALLDEVVRKKTVAGCNALVLHKGEEVLYCQSGVADVEIQTPIARDSLFRVFSMTKPITAVAALILLEEGKISFAEPVKHYLPGFEKLKVLENGELVDARGELFLWDLLNMTCGLQYPDDSVAGKAVGDVFRRVQSEGLTTQQVANGLGECPMILHPRNGYVYGTSADVMGAVIEVASGMRFGEFLKQRIFEPLGMCDTDFWVPPEKQHRLAKTYARNPEGNLVEDRGIKLGISVKMDKPATFESGGAGLVSSVDDYAKFGTMLLNGGTANGHRILSSRTLNLLAESTLPEYLRKDFSFGNPGYSYTAFMRRKNSTELANMLASKGEYGWGGALGTWFSNSPEEQMTILLMTQKGYAGVDDWTDLHGKLYNLVMSSPEMEQRLK